jgi:hypothetical protein
VAKSCERPQYVSNMVTLGRLTLARKWSPTTTRREALQVKEKGEKYLTSSKKETATRLYRHESIVWVQSVWRGMGKHMPTCELGQ